MMPFLLFNAPFSNVLCVARIKINYFGIHIFVVSFKSLYDLYIAWNLLKAFINCLCILLI